MRTEHLLAFATAMIAITFSSCTAYQSARRGEDDYDAAIERNARAEEMLKNQQKSMDSIHDQSLRR